MNTRRGGALQSHTVRLEGGGWVIVQEVWHWRWYSLRCNWMNRHRHGWTILAKRNRRLRQNTLMVKYGPPSRRYPRRVD